MPFDNILKSVQNNPAITGVLSGAAGGALVSAFKNQKSAKKLLKAGGLLAVGGIAYKAYQSYRQNQQVAASDSPTIPDIPQERFEAVVDTERAAS